VQVSVVVISRTEHGGNCGPSVLLAAGAGAGVPAEPGGCVETLKPRLSGSLTPGGTVMKTSTVSAPSPLDGAASSTDARAARVCHVRADLELDRVLPDDPDRWAGGSQAAPGDRHRCG
jgi:hypothetical protein